MKKINTYEDFAKIAEYVESKLRDETACGGAWFHSEEAFDEWAGDIFEEVIEYTLNYVGIETNFDK